jgi:hypothetical protein
MSSIKQVLSGVAWALLLLVGAMGADAKLPALLLIKTETTRLLNTFDVFAKRQNAAK